MTTTEDSATSGPLAGLRIIDISTYVAGPSSTMTLAQLGAEVIRIDPIGGATDTRRLPLDSHGNSLYWAGLNKAKKSVEIDISSPEGRELVTALVAAPGTGNGIVVTNAVGQRWLSYEALSERRLDLIQVHITGRSDGKPAVDYTVNCEVGLPFLTGPVDFERPVNHVLPAWDVACAYQAAFAIMAAVDYRRRTGAGAELKLALSDVAFTTLSHLGVLAEAELLAQDRPSIGNHIYGAFGRDFGTADGQRVMVAAISAGQWKALVKACGAEQGIAALEASCGLDFADEAQRYQGRDAIAALLEPWFAARSRADAERLLEQHRVCWGRYSTVRELLAADARVSSANAVFERITTPGVGEHLSAGAAVRAGAMAREPTRPAPLLGSHTDEILHQVLGLDGAAIGRLHDAGVVAGPERDPTYAKAGAR